MFTLVEHLLSTYYILSIAKGTLDCLIKKNRTQPFLLPPPTIQSVLNQWFEGKAYVLSLFMEHPTYDFIYGKVFFV